MFEVGADAENASRVVVANIMKEIETQLLGLTINAPDWYVSSCHRDWSLMHYLGTHYAR